MEGPRVAGGSERSERGGRGMVRKKVRERGRLPSSRTINLPFTKLSFIGGGNYLEFNIPVRLSILIRLSIYRLLFLTLLRASNA